jgi:hypothetical protein
MERMEHEAPAAWGEDANTIFAAYAEGGQAALDYLDGRGFQTWHDAHNYCRMRELREFIDALSPDSEYALVAAEL